MIEHWIQTMGAGGIDVDDVKVALMAALVVIIPRATMLVVAAIEVQTRRLLQAHRVSQATPPTDAPSKGENP
jgi:hypothetical protein